MTISESKIVTSAEHIASRLETLARPMVFTNGCFDILHRGHVHYLEQAAALGASLIVAVNSDSSVHALSKGADRPINSLEDRMAVLAALQCVSLVTFFHAPTPIELIEMITPKYLVKGGDWGPEEIVGAEHVRTHGGEVRSIPIRYHRSTTDLIRRIRDRRGP